MKLEDQVLTIEQAKHLQKLGLDMSDAAMAWVMRNHCQGYYIDFNQGGIYYQDLIPTYTLQETWDKLPYKIKTPRYDILQLDFIDYELMYHDKETGYVKHWETGKIIESAYDMLCWVLENGYLKEETK